MTIRGRAIALASAASWLVAVATTGQPVHTAEALAANSPGVLERLHADGLVLLEQTDEDRSNGFFQALTLFRMGPDQAMDLLVQTDRQREFRPDLESIRNIERSEQLAIDEHDLKIVFIKIHYRLKIRIDRVAREMSWALDESFANDLEHISGFWKLWPMDDGGTLGHFGAAVRLGPALPKWLQNRATKSRIPKTVENTRRWIDSGGAWRP